MGALSAVVIIVCAVGLSSVLGRYVRAPLPFVQIALGAVCALPVIGASVALDPELFLILFVAPLLFTDAWQTSKRAFVREWRTIVTAAFGLSLFTVAGAGLFVHWLVPSIPLAVAFALASVLSPTDAVATQAIVRNSPLPQRVMHVLEGEALLNDATGLVALRMSVIAALTGTFSLTQAAMTLVVTAVGGFIIGIIVAAVAVRLVQTLARPGDLSSILLILVVPVAAFAIAEHLHVSGVLSAVAAGLSGEVISRRYAIDFSTRLTTAAVWSLISFALNGSIFVILGMQLPSIIANGPQVAHVLGVANTWMVVEYAVAITLALLFLRWAWTFVSFGLNIFRAIRRHVVLPPARIMRNLHFAVTFAGVRGAVTLGAVLTLPLTLDNGADFPGRDAAIFLATVVILASLVISSAVLPGIARALTGFRLPDAPTGDEEHEVRVKLARAALSAIEAHVQRVGDSAHDEERAALTATSASVMAPYRRLLALDDTDAQAAEDARRASTQHRELRETAIKARRLALADMLRADEIDDALYRRIMREIDYAEASEAR